MQIRAHHHSYVPAVEHVALQAERAREVLGRLGLARAGGARGRAAQDQALRLRARVRSGCDAVRASFACQSLVCMIGASLTICEKPYINDKELARACVSVM